MVSKGELGVSYLIGVGIVLSGTLGIGVAMPSGVVEHTSTSLLGLTMGLMVAAGFSLTGIGLANSQLDDERVWRVAAWSTLGLGVPTGIALLLPLWYPSLLHGIDWRSVVMVNVAAGGVVGVLVGSLFELRAEHERTRALNQRNTVFLRLFRHDIRTSINLLRGHVDRLDVDAEEPIEVIHEQIDHVERLSDAAHRLEELESMTETEPIDLGRLVEERVDDLRRTEDRVTVETNVRPGTYVWANDLLASVVDNLLRNAVEHGATEEESEADGHPWLAVSVRSAEGRTGVVELRVRDDGPGFSETELAVHTGATETALQHSDGIGLWLVRWIVDSFDGDVTVANHAEGGAVVTVALPAADPDAAAVSPDP
ncbi:sensor histidine kinase [Haloplanus halophilus]|uniref:sensor histidine kinase n=1 Tax=Haloplanus halophilus TaxID=2949993 RepID=UPI0020414BF4|nr:HAMP domain-containing sensor histidine kinase [Haloplanus sp. GDY1]